VLGIGVPGPAGELGGHVKVPLDPKEGVGHGLIVCVATRVTTATVPRLT
jgi:hypothetical protein